MTGAHALGAAAWLAVVVAAATAIGSLAAKVRGGDRLDRCLTGVFASTAQVIAVGVALACLGLFSRWWFFGAQLAVGVGAVIIGSRRAPAAVSGEPAKSVGVSDVVAGLSAAFLVLALGVALPAGRSQHFESLHYHYAGVAHFVTEHTLWTLPFQNPAFFTANHPQNAELLYSVLALATDGDELIYTLGLPLFGLITFLGGAVIAREAGGSPALGGLAALAVITSPMVFGNQARSIATDLPAVAFVVVAVAFLASERRGQLTVALAGVALGAALGTKYTAIVPVAFLAVLAVVRLRSSRALWLMPGLLALGAPWFVRNWVAAGNPLYPQEVAVGGSAIFEGGETPLEIYSNTIASHVLHTRTDALRTWADLVSDFYGPIALVAALGAIAALVIRLRGTSRSVSRIVGGVALVAAAAYAVTPYTGAGVPPLAFLMGSNLRYAILAIVLGAVAASIATPRLPAVAVLAFALVWSVWRLAAHPIREDVELSPGLVATAVLVAVAVPLASLLRPRLPKVNVSVAAGLITVVAVASALIGPRGGSASAPVEKALREVGADRVVVVGVDDLRSVIGGRFERKPVALTPGPPYASAPFGSSGALRRALDRQELDVAAIGSDAHPGVPDNFEASPDWCEVGEFSGVTVYERLARGQCAGGRAGNAPSP